MINYCGYISMMKNIIFYKIYKNPFKTINTYWNVNGFAKNKKESTMVIAFLPVVTAEENKCYYFKNSVTAKEHNIVFNINR